MHTPIQLIIGLGNPGAAYDKTRHNAGAWFVETLAAQTHTTLRPETKFYGQYCRVQFDKQECHLLLPTTFMNRCGQAVKAVTSFYRIPVEAILVAHDDLDLSVGIARLKFDGGHGGHNGLRDIIDHFGSKQFHRLRVGIGHPGNREQVTDYVLNKPSRDEQAHIHTAIATATGVLPEILAGHWQKAMNKLHTQLTAPTQNTR